MAHHRCTGCKQESYPRHKWKGGVYCDDCVNFIKGGGRSGWFRRSFLGEIWDTIVDLVDRVFRPESPKRTTRAKERQVMSRMKQMEHRARSIPANPQSGLGGRH